MEAVTTMEANGVSQVRSGLKKEIRHNPGGVTSVMLNRKSCLVAAGGDERHAQSLRLQLKILEEFQKEKEKPIVTIQSRPRF